MTATATVPNFAHETGHRCRDCGAFHYPPRTLCRICRGRRFAAEPLSGRGVVHALPPLTRDLSASLRRWVSVWVELAEGTLIRAELAAEEAIVGLPVELVPRQQRLLRARPAIGHAFRALEPAGRALGITGALPPAPVTQPAISNRRLSLT
jgi:uncharacterized OB-fold protein